MAAPKENLLSLGHLTGTERTTFTKQREHSLRKSVNRLMPQTEFSTLQGEEHFRKMHLQQRWQELRERELKAQQHNRQLLQQFEEAQDTLREMLTLTTAMKTIRKEYERYLEESTPRWKQQLQEKTQAAQKKRMEEYLRACLKDTEDQAINSSADRPFPSQGHTAKPQQNAAPQKHFSQNNHAGYNQDGSPHLPYMRSYWPTQPPIRVPHQPRGSSHGAQAYAPQPIFPHPIQPHHPTSTPCHLHPWTRPNQPDWASQQPDYPWSWITGAAGIPSGPEVLWGQIHVEEPPPEPAQVSTEEAETSRGPSSQRERGGGSRSSDLSQELDTKPVRLPSSPAESSESSRESSQMSRERRKRTEKRGRSRQNSSDGERRSSRELSRTSSTIIAAAATTAQSSESDDSSAKSRTSSRRRSAGLAAGSPKAESTAKKTVLSKGHDSGSRKDGSRSGSPVKESGSEKAGDKSPDDRSESSREDSGSQREEETESVSVRIQNHGGVEIEKKESSSSKENSEEEESEEEEEQKKSLGDEKEDDVEEKEERDEEQEEGGVEDDDEVSERKTTSEEDEETGAEAEMEEHGSEGKVKNEERENEKKSSASSHDEEEGEDEESEEGDERMKEDGESDEEDEGGDGEEEEEQRGDEAEDRDSDDSIISPPNKSKKMQIIPEASEEDEDEEDEEGSKQESSEDEEDESGDENIEQLLAPQEQPQKEQQKDVRADEKQEAIYDQVEIFRADKSPKTDHSSDSEEFDHFYD